jgi:hypothetical protein
MATESQDLKKTVKKVSNEELAAQNKHAFDQVIGDPYAYPDPIDGQYMKLKSNTSIRVQNLENESSGTGNAAKPSSLDFFIDVENAIRDGLEVWDRNSGSPLPVKVLVALFYNTYFYECDKRFAPAERPSIEQHIGRILIARKISPPSKYFTTIRK